MTWFSESAKIAIVILSINDPFKLLIIKVIFVKPVVIDLPSPAQKEHPNIKHIYELYRSILSIQTYISFFSVPPFLHQNS